jgi:hypothetical protein
MARVIGIVLAGTGTVVALDAAGTLAAGPLGFPYPPLAVVSLLIYLAVGAAGAWYGGLATGTAAGLAVGFLDATLGPLVAWVIGPGPVGTSELRLAVFSYGIAVTAATAGLIGLVGAAVVRRLERRGLGLSTADPALTPALGAERRRG